MRPSSGDGVVGAGVTSITTGSFPCRICGQPSRSHLTAPGSTPRCPLTLRHLRVTSAANHKLGSRFTSRRRSQPLLLVPHLLPFCAFCWPDPDFGLVRLHLLSTVNCSKPTRSYSCDDQGRANRKVQGGSRLGSTGKGREPPPAQEGVCGIPHGAQLDMMDPSIWLGKSNSLGRGH